MLSRHAGGGQRGAWHVVLAACGADRKTAAVRIRAIIDESGGAVGWRVPISPATVSRILPRFEPRTSHFRRSQGQSDFARVYTTKPLVRAPSDYATATLAPSKGRLMRCTVDGLTPNRSAMTRMPGRPGVARASRIRFSSAAAIGGRPSRFPSLLALASPARTRSWIMARSNSANTPII